MEEIDTKKPFKFETWRKLLRFAAAHKGRFILVIGMMMLVAAYDAASPFITGWVLDVIVVGGRMEALPAFIAFWAAAMTLQAAMIRLFIGESGKLEMGMNRAIRQACFERLQRLDLAYYDRSSAGWILARVTSDIGRLADVVAWGLVDATWGFSVMAGMGALMFLRHPGLAAVTLAVLPPLVALSVVVEKKLFARSREVRALNSKLTAAYGEDIRGARAVKVLGAERGRGRDFRGKSEAMRLASTRHLVLSAFYLPAVIALGYVGTALSLWKGGSAAIDGAITYGTLVAFVFAALQFFDPATDLARVLADVQYAQASAERVVGLLDEKAEIVDTPAALERLRSAGPGARAPRLSGRIVYENVSFRYGDGPVVLHDFSLEVPAGATVAFVGETGSGKSTTVNLACRFYEPTSGRILIDGTDYRELPLAWLRGKLGYVLQQPYLFTGTIRENIRYGRLDATDAEVEEAARLARAHEFIVGFEKGYESPVGEGGALLSTGQKQLVSIARAVLADPAIVVLDEATSSVDAETEKLVQEAAKVALAGRTTLVVAHRLSTIVHADLIVALRDGRVVERGTHRELLARRGYYRRLYEAQFMEEKEEEALVGARGEGVAAV